VIDERQPIHAAHPAVVGQPRDRRRAFPLAHVVDQAVVAS
jgi:hypothetical protein